jgi:hypothetical protein
MTHPLLPFCASAYLAQVQSGARPFTISEITISDVVRFISLGDDWYLLKVCYLIIIFLLISF